MQGHDECETTRAVDKTARSTARYNATQPSTAHHVPALEGVEGLRHLLGQEHVCGIAPRPAPHGGGPDALFGGGMVCVG